MRKRFPKEKMRHEVAVQRFASPLRDAAPSALEEFWHNRHDYLLAENAHWDDLSPCNFSGRATCLVVDPADPNLLFAGSAAGGLWKSADGGASWTSCWPNAISQSIGAVAIDPDDCTRILCATGEGNLSTASYPGGGIYLSDNGGFTWRSFVWTHGKRRMSAEDRDRMPRRVASISFSASHPRTRRRQIAVGSISNDEELLGGLYLQDLETGGLKFVDFWSSRPYNCYSAVFHPTRAETLFAAVEAGGAVNGIWRTEDGGTSWKHVTKDVFPGESCGRISIAISPKDPSILFALVSNRGRRVLGVFRSDTGGDSWTDVTGPEFDDQGQLAFNNTIAIHPEDPRIVVCGAQGLLRTTDGGRIWRSIGESHRAITSTRRNARYVHPDHHAVVMPGGNVLYSANDGGIAKSLDLGETWEGASHGMNTVMFYAIDVSPVNEQIYGGGAQDNGTIMAGVNPGFGLRPKGSGPEHVQVAEGDGGYLVCDPDEEELVFASTFSTETRCHEPGRRWTAGLLSNKWRDASPVVSRVEKDVLGLTVMAVRPAFADKRKELLLGTNRLWRTVNNGRSWRTTEFSEFDGSAITAIEVAHADPSVVYVGTAKGGVFRSLDGGYDWTDDLAGPEIPARVITQIETHPKDARHVVVTVASTGRPAPTLDGKSVAFGHVFRSKNSGERWEDLDNGQLPNVVFNGLAFETRAPYRLFVAGDAGPWALETDGLWISIAGDMPSAVISDIIYHHSSRTLTAGTYGRGIWRMKVPRSFDTRLLPEKLGDVDQLLPPMEGFLLDPWVQVPEPLAPAQDTAFDAFPRLTTFACSSVKDAVGYVFETVTDNGFTKVLASAGPTAEATMGGAGDYTWRCWALLPSSRCSMPSEPLRFRYLG